MKFEGDPREWYFVLVDEWLIPTESGRDPLPETFDDLEEAREFATAYLEGERKSFFEATGVKASVPAQYGQLCVMISPEEGQEDEWYECVKIVPMYCGVMPVYGWMPAAVPKEL